MTMVYNLKHKNNKIKKNSGQCLLKFTEKFKINNFLSHECFSFLTILLTVLLKLKHKTFHIVMLASALAYKGKDGKLNEINCRM